MLPTARNLLLISVDTLRADRLGCNGYNRGTTPHLDRLAASGASFRQATAPSPWTLPSHASMFTGLSPKRHGAKGLKGSIAKDAATMAELLLGQGFQTRAVISSTVLEGGGLKRGFETVNLVETGGPHPSAVTPGAIEALDSFDPTRPFFLLAHYIDPHTDYGALEPFASRFAGPYEGRATGIGQQLYRVVSGELEFDLADASQLSDLYDSGVAQVDAQIELLLAHLRNSEQGAQTLVIVTADHGEEFMEHGGLMHGFNHHEEMIRVPLILAGPGIPKGYVSSTPVSLMDLVPTSLAALGLPPREGLDGLDLRGIWSASETSPRVRAFYYEADWDPPLPGRRSLSRGWDRALRVGRHKLHLNLQTGRVLLFDLSLDPLELKDLSAQQPALVDALRAKLTRYLEASDEPGHSAAEPDLSEDELQKLMQLGYAGANSDED